MTTSKKKVLRLLLNSKGEIHFIYDDALAPLIEAGEAQVTRASNVEPNPDGQGWIADIKGGPRLGPFRLREEALKAEVSYLEEKLFHRKEGNGTSTSNSTEVLSKR